MSAKSEHLHTSEFFVNGLIGGSRNGAAFFVAQAGRSCRSAENVIITILRDSRRIWNIIA